MNRAVRNWGTTGTQHPVHPRALDETLSPDWGQGNALGRLDEEKQDRLYYATRLAAAWATVDA